MMGCMIVAEAGWLVVESLASSARMSGCGDECSGCNAESVRWFYGSPGRGTLTAAMISVSVSRAQCALSEPDLQCVYACQATYVLMPEPCRCRVKTVAYVLTPMDRCCR